MRKRREDDAVFRRPQNEQADSSSSFFSNEDEKRSKTSDAPDVIEEKKQEAEIKSADSDAPEAAQLSREEADKIWSESAERSANAKPAQIQREESAASSDLNAKNKNKKRKGNEEGGSLLKRFSVIVLVVILFLLVAVTVLSAFVDTSSPPFSVLAKPKQFIIRVFTPVQELFSGVADKVEEFLRTEKISGNIEYEYQKLLEQVDELASEAAMAEEYKRQINDLYDLMDEINRNTDLNPVAANVIGHETGNYFSVLTVNVGSLHGVKDYMAVVYAGGLVGYTYDTEETTCKVRCIIDGDATVFAMLQSSRDQGAIKGTLSIDGQARCRMYYLPENSLPRPGDMVVTSGVGMEFPKGIPIGTVRESTRGLDNNMSYIVVDPIVDFQHLEYVVIYRYQPAYAEEAQSRTASVQTTLEPLVTARPQPTFQMGEDFELDADTTDTPEETPETEPTDILDGGTSSPAEATVSPAEETPRPENLSYQTPDNMLSTETPLPTLSPIPSPTPTPVFNPHELTVEEDE